MPILLKGEQKVKYESLDDDTVTSIYNQLNLIFTQFVNTISNFRPGLVKDMLLDDAALVEVINRVDKRKEHANIFHKIEAPNEFRMIALYCYWIVKLRPFGLYIDKANNKKGSKIHPEKVNEAFCLFLYINIIKLIYREHFKKEITLDKAYLKELAYTLRYRDVNKATLIMLLEPKFSFEN